MTVRLLIPSLLACLLLCALPLSGTTAHAQPRDAKLKHFTVRDGLSFGSILAIAQDREGFMWIGTPNGLFRHDGYSFTAYRRDPGDPTSLASDTVQALYVDRRGTLWLGARGAGLDRYDPTTDAFVHYRPDPDDPTSLGSDEVRAIQEDRAGRLWIGTYGSGLNLLDRDTGAFTRYPFSREDPDAPTSLNDANVHVLHEGRDGALWVGTAGGGLNRLDPDTGTFTRYVHDATDEHSLISDDVWVLEEDAAGNLWVGTSPGWVHRMDPAEPGRFTRYQWSDLGRLSIILSSQDGTLWTGANNCCVGRYDPVGDTFRSHGLPSTLAFGVMTAAHESRDGTLWFGTAEGLERFDPAPSAVSEVDYEPPFEHDTQAAAIYVDRDGILWIGGGKALMRYDRSADRSTWYVHDPEDPRSLPESNSSLMHGLNSVGFVHEDREGNLWVASPLALSKLDRRTGIFTPYRIIPEGSAGIGGGWIVGVEEDEAGNLWVAMLGSGIGKLDPRTGAFTRYQPREDGMQNPFIQALLRARDGTFWMALGDGLLHFDPQTEAFARFTPGEDADPRVGSDVHSIYEDGQGRIWYGAMHVNSGLSIFDPRTEAFSYLDSPAQAVHSILGDLQGRIWIHADDRILMYDPGTAAFTTFDEGSGLTGWIGDMAGGSTAYRSASGELFFGMIGGVKSFFPDQVLAPKTSSPPQVTLTGLEVFNQPVRPSTEGPLQKVIWQAERVRLRHDQNTFTLSFAAMDFHNPEANRYRYRLEGYDTDWREAGTARRAEYVQVPTGDYVFRVRGANRDGVWNEEGATIRVAVLPPWWRTGWAYAAYGLVVVVGLVAVDRVQRRRLVARERERARERELEQAREIEKAYTELKTAKDRLVQQEKMASLGALTAGIAHEIKNPLNFVNNFAEINAELTDELHEAWQNGAADVEELLDHLKKNAALINQHGKRADDIVRAMMQHAAGGTGRRQEADVNALVEEYVNLAYYGKRARQPDFECEVGRTYDERIGTVEVVPQEIGRVLLNLLTNAFDAVEQRAAKADAGYVPTVTVTTRQAGGQVEIRVADNGVGIPRATQDKIFEPFFTTKPAGSGTGLGLSLSYDIVTQGHGGKLEVESTEGEGATFIVTLPG